MAEAIQQPNKACFGPGRNRPGKNRSELLNDDYCYRWLKANGHGFCAANLEYLGKHFDQNDKPLTLSIPSFYRAPKFSHVWLEAGVPLLAE
jgi:hypothetical protein